MDSHGNYSVPKNVENIESYNLSKQPSTVFESEGLLSHLSQATGVENTQSFKLLSDINANNEYLRLTESQQTTIPSLHQSPDPSSSDDLPLDNNGRFNRIRRKRLVHPNVTDADFWISPTTQNNTTVHSDSIVSAVQGQDSSTVPHKKMPTNHNTQKPITVRPNKTVPIHQRQAALVGDSDPIVLKL